MAETALKGLKLSAIFALLFVAYWYFNLLNIDVGGGEKSTMLLPLLVGLTLILSSGVLLGYYSGRFKSKRKLKMVLLALLVYWYNAFIVAMFMILSEPGNTNFDIVFGAIMLATSSLFLVWFSLPVVLASLVLESKTRPRNI